MHSGTYHIEKAFLTSLKEGVVELSRDWNRRTMPKIGLKGKRSAGMSFRSLTASNYAIESRYYFDEKGRCVFVFFPEEYPAVDYDTTEVYVAGAFSGWDEAIGASEWLMSKDFVDGREALILRCNLQRLENQDTLRFKFVTEQGHWLPIDVEAPNVENDGEGNWNYIVYKEKTGLHRLGFVLDEPVELSESNYIEFRSRKHAEAPSYLDPGDFFYDLRSDKELGAVISESETLFRIFAPRAKWVKVGVFRDLAKADEIDWIVMERDDDFVWEAKIDQNLVGLYYWFRLDGPQCEFSLFDPERRVLDPYAKATVSREGPGIIIDDSQYSAWDRNEYWAPQWQDLVVLEAHTRDLTAGLPGVVASGKPIGYEQLKAFAQREDFYPRGLGVNAIELQPMQENDSQTQEEYHWGYMTANFFSPASSYAQDPKHGSQVEEFRGLVAEMHRQGFAVILDVVYNHVGEPAHLMFIDKQYYFHLANDGTPTNWSGCGNDLRANAPMAKRIVIESLKRMALFYGVDGFRFDLADLVGKDVLVDVERELKAVRPDIILIAEPWSFRGHIGMELRDTGYSSWNDGYREFVKKYVKGKGDQSGLSYFMKGSPEHYATWPSQTVNYVESHDDRVWIDNITENSDYDGSYPSINDIRRSHMMVSILMMSVGIPMLHSGLDFLRSKGGVNNTYLRGDINALDYSRAHQFSGTAAYFRNWVAFRQSEQGRLLRQYSRPGELFYDFICPEDRNALIMILNADGSEGAERLMFALNPEFEALEQPLGVWSDCEWTLVADHERFWTDEEQALANRPGQNLTLPPLACALWKSRIG